MPPSSSSHRRVCTLLLVVLGVGVITIGGAATAQPPPTTPTLQAAAEQLPASCDFPFAYKGDVHFGCMPFGGRAYCIAPGDEGEWVRCPEGVVDLRVDMPSGAASAGDVANAVPLANAPAEAIKLSEVVPKAAIDGVPDWIEVANGGDTPVDLAGLRIRNADGDELVVECPLPVPARGFAVFFAAAKAAANATAAAPSSSPPPPSPPPPPSSCVTLPFKLGSEDRISLLAPGPSNRTLDAVAWRKGDVPRGTSLGRPMSSGGQAFEVLASATPRRMNAPPLGEGPYGMHFLGGRALDPKTVSPTTRAMQSGVPFAVLKTFSSKPIPNFPKARAELWVSGCGLSRAGAMAETNGTVTNARGAVCTFSDAPHLDTEVGVEVRGRSSQKFPKKQYSVELWTNAENKDEEGGGTAQAGAGGSAQSALTEGGVDAADFEHAILGMPENADWTLNGDFIDRSLLRNPLAMRLWRDLGRWAPRQAFVELYLWTPDDAASRSDSYYYEVKHAPLSYQQHYHGVYALRENIKRSKGRMGLPKLGPSPIDGTREGAYILEFRSVEHENLFRNPEPSEPSVLDIGATRVFFKYPKNAMPTDRTRVASFLKTLEGVLFDDDRWLDPAQGYKTLVDVPSFADYFLHTEITKNLDGYISSVYMSLSHNGTLTAGPPWDFDLAFGNSNGWDGFYRGAEGWTFQGPNQRQYSRLVQWFRRMLSDDAFKAVVLDRWAQLREPQGGALSTRAVGRALAEARRVLETSGAAERNAQRWPIYEVSSGDGRIPIAGHMGSWAGEASGLASWTRDRLEWMDKALDDFAQGGAMAAAEVRTDRGDRTMLDRIRENFVGAFYPWRMRFD